MSVSPHTPFTKKHHISNSYEKMDNYLEISGRRNSCLSDHQFKKSMIVSDSNVIKPNNNFQKKRETKGGDNKKEECESDSESIKSLNKSSKFINKKSYRNNQDEPEKKQKNLYKTELCRNWEETSHCRYGTKCQYAHGAADLREIDRHPKYKTQKCRTFHQTGSCPYGARCTFRHFNLPGDALEMKNLEQQEQEEKRAVTATATAADIAAADTVAADTATAETQQLKQQDRPSIFSAQNKKMLEQNWFLDSGLLSRHETNGFPKRSLLMHQFNNTFDPEDSLLPSNAESLLPHQLLFDLESPQEEEEEDQQQPARCPLRNYVSLPSFSNFQVSHQHPQPQQQQECKTFFHPWLF